MDELINDDRTSPDQAIRGPVDRRKKGDRRTNPYSGMVPHQGEQRLSSRDRRSTGRRGGHTP